LSRNAGKKLKIYAE